MIIACHQACDSKPRLLLLSRELCHVHHHHAIIMEGVPGGVAEGVPGGAAEGVPGGVAARRPLARCSLRAQATVQSTRVVQQAAGEIPRDHQEYHIRRQAIKGSGRGW